MPKAPEKPDLTEHEEEAVPLDDVVRKLLVARPAPRKAVEPKSKAPGARHPLTGEQ